MPAVVTICPMVAMIHITTVIPISRMVRKSAVMFPSGVIETAVIEISGVVSVEDRPVVFKIDAVMIVAIPGRIVIISITGEIGFTDCGIGVISAVINRRGGRSRCGGVYGRGRWDRPSHINPGNGNPETNMRTDDYLRIAFSSDEAGSCNSGEDKQLFTHCHNRFSLAFAKLRFHIQ